MLTWNNFCALTVKGTKSVQGYVEWIKDIFSTFFFKHLVTSLPQVLSHELLWGKKVPSGCDI